MRGVEPVRTAAIISSDSEEYDVAGIVDSQGRRWTVSAARTDTAGARSEAEIVVLDMLARTPLRDVVQRPEGYARLPEGGRAVVCPALPGTPLHFTQLQDDEGTARSLGRLIAQIHAVPRDLAETSCVEVFSPAETRARHRARLARIQDAGHRLPPTVAQRWEHVMDDDQLWTYTPRFVHGELSEDHLLTAQTHPSTATTGIFSGILHWGSARVDDPATDLAWLVSTLNPDMWDVLFSAYTETISAAGKAPDPQLVDRAHILGEFAVLDWLLHGIDANDESVIRDADGMLADLESDLAEIARLEAEQAFDDLAAEEDYHTDGYDHLTSDQDHRVTDQDHRAAERELGDPEREHDGIAHDSQGAEHDRATTRHEATPEDARPDNTRS